MTISIIKSTITNATLLLLLFLTFAVLSPVAGQMFGLGFLLLGFIMAGTRIVKRNRNAYHNGTNTRSIFLRNTTLEIFGILLAVVFAGLLGRYLAQAATVQIAHDLTRMMMGILIGILVGAGVGLLVHRVFQKASPGK
jgi:F0F1-type ATP synthase assembly protein I